MDDPFLVGGLERLGNLSRDGQRFADRDDRLGNPLRERVAVDELEHERRGAVDRLEAIDRGNLRMIQRRQQPRLAIEAGAPLGIGREQRRQHLDRHIAAEGRIVRAIHLAHAAGAEQPDDAIRTELPADQRLTLLGRRWSHQRARWPIEKVLRAAGVREQRLDFLAQRFVARTRLAQKRRALIRMCARAPPRTGRRPSSSAGRSL